MFAVTVCSHHFSVTGYDRGGKDILVQFAMRYAEYMYIRRWNGDVDKQLTRIFASSTRDRMEMRFHIKMLDEFKEYIVRSGYDVSAIKLTTVPMYDPVQVAYSPSPTFVARDYQVPIIQFLVSPGKIKLLTLQTGKGKTATTLMALAEMGVRAVVVIRAQYVERWMTDLSGPNSVLRLSPHELMVVRGQKDLKALIALAKADALHAKVIVITGKTMYSFYDHYETFNRDTSYYGCHPAEFYPLLKAGVRIIDEVHQDFHFNFTQDLYTHVLKTISLSATMETDKPLVSKLYRLMFPQDSRAKTVGYDKYIVVKAMFYGLSQDTLRKNRIKYVRRGMGSYSHVDFEDSVLDTKATTKRYMEMIESVVDVQYMAIRKPGQKMLIFAAKVEMCVEIANYLQKRYRELKVCKFTGGDDYNDLLSSDISVSTLGKTGTAVDIPGLLVVLSTTAVDSAESNIQAMGRLRNLNGEPTTNPVFLYFVCTDIPQQLRYHQRKIDKFKDKALSHQVIELGMKL